MANDTVQWIKPTPAQKARLKLELEKRSEYEKKRRFDCLPDHGRCCNCFGDFRALTDRKADDDKNSDGRSKEIR
jgi:hypothetical protein